MVLLYCATDFGVFVVCFSLFVSVLLLLIAISCLVVLFVVDREALFVLLDCIIELVASYFVCVGLGMVWLGFVWDCACVCYEMLTDYSLLGVLFACGYLVYGYCLYSFVKACFDSWVIWAFAIV